MKRALKKISFNRGVNYLCLTSQITMRSRKKNISHVVKLCHYFPVTVIWQLTDKKALFLKNFTAHVLVSARNQTYSERSCNLPETWLLRRNNFFTTCGKRKSRRSIDIEKKVITVLDAFLYEALGNVKINLETSCSVKLHITSLVNHVLLYPTRNLKHFLLKMHMGNVFNLFILLLPQVLKHHLPQATTMAHMHEYLI